MKGTGETLEKAAEAAVQLPAELITSTTQAAGLGFNTLVGNISETFGFPNMNEPGAKDPLVSVLKGDENMLPYERDPLVHLWHKIFGGPIGETWRPL